MNRSVEEWVGATADTAIPDRVRLRVFERCHGACGVCGRKIGPADTWIVEHLIALANGGENRERNLGVTCGWCKPEKDAADIKITAHGRRVRARHLGIKKTRRPFPGSKASGLRKRMDGTVERRHARYDAQTDNPATEGEDV